MKMNWERFAEDSLQKSTVRPAFFGTCIVWLLLLIFFAFAPGVQKKEEFSPIQLTLAAPQKSAERPVQEPILREKNAVPEKNSSSSVSAAPEKAGSLSAAAAPEDVRNAVPEKKSAQAAAPKASSPVPVENKSAPAKAKITYKKSVDELLAEQSGSKKQAQWDDSVFGDDTAAVSSQSAAHSDAVNKGISGAAALSGTAAEAVQHTGKTVARSDIDSSFHEAASATRNMLGTIAATTYAADSRGVRSSAEINTEETPDGSVALKMSDGSSRILLEPEKPVIMISEENAGLIDSSRTVTVSFKVLSGGNVPRTEIGFAPASLLPLQIQAEIREQISKWRFKPAAADGFARFEYSIIKR